MEGWRRFFRRFVRSRPRSSDISDVERLINYQFTRFELLELALTHRSVARAQTGDGLSNERLEFLGDSVLGLIVAELLYTDRPDESEGDLTKRKSMLVNETSLAYVGVDVGLNEFIRLSQEERRMGGHERASIVADAVEAVIGAVYLDGGHAPARIVVERLVYARRDAILRDTVPRNYKGELLELAQGRGDGSPRYEVISEAGPDHHKVFRVSVAISGRVVGEGEGLSKKEAEQNAAAKALPRYELHSITSDKHGDR